MVIVGMALAVLGGLVPALPAAAKQPVGQGPYTGPPPATGPVSADELRPVEPRPTQDEGRPGDARNRMADEIRAAVADQNRPRHTATTPRSPQDQAQADRIAAARAEGLIPDNLPALPPGADTTVDQIPYDTSEPRKADPPLGTVRIPARAIAHTASLEDLGEYNASYAPATDFDVHPRFDRAGFIWVRVTNTSRVTWPAASVSLGYRVFQPAGTQIKIGVAASLTNDVPPGFWVDLYAQILPLGQGTFHIFFDMLDSTSSAPWFTQHGVLASRDAQFTNPHFPPTGQASNPDNGQAVASPAPVVQVFVQADGSLPNTAYIQLCTNESISTGCLESGWLNVSLSGFSGHARWFPILTWNTAYYWRFKVRDSSTPNPPWSQTSAFTVVVPNNSGPAFFGADAGALDEAGVNLYLGNYVRQETDLAYPAPPSAIPLRLERVYNSASTSPGAFGTGWSSLLDVNVAASDTWDGFHLRTVTFPDGKQTMHGQSLDGSWAPALPSGAGTTMSTVSGRAVLDVVGGTHYEFGNTGGRLSRVEAPNGDIILLEEDAVTHKVMRALDTRTRRSLYFTWNGSRIATVSSAPAPGPGVVTWTYSYTNDLLTRVCDAEPTPNCTAYTYTTDRRLTRVQRPNAANNLNIDYTGTFVRAVGFPAVTPGVYVKTWQYERLAPDTEIGSLKVHVKDPANTDVYYEFGGYFGASGELLQRHIGPEVQNPRNTRYWRYDQFGRLTGFIDENNNAVTYAWDVATGQIQAVVEPTTGSDVTVKRIRYAKNDQPGIDPRWARNVVSAEDGNRNATTYTYWNGLVATKTLPPTPSTPSGARTISTYTCQSGPAPPVVNDPGAPPESFQPCGLLATMTDPDGHVTRYAYNRYGDQSQVITPSGAVTNTFYDGLGNALRRFVVTPTNPSGTTTTFTYDTHGRVLTETDPVVVNPDNSTPHQQMVTNTYDGDGNLIRQVQSDRADPATWPGADAARTTEFGYDERDRQTSVRRNGRVVSTTTYDGMSRVLKTVDANGGEYESTYDNLGRLSTVVLANFRARPPDAPRRVRLEAYTYDDAGRKASFTNAMGRTVRYTYTANNLLATQNFADFQDPDSGARRDILLHQYTYDPAGNLVRDVSGSGSGARTTTYGYDARNQRTSMTLDPAGRNRRTTYQYDPAGNVTATIVSNAERAETSTTGYDANGQVTSSAVIVDDDNNSLVTRYTRDALNRVLSVTDPNGSTTNHTYDVAGRLSIVEQPAVSAEDGSGAPATTVRPKTTYGHNTFGEITSVRDPRGQVFRFHYDNFGQRTRVTYPSYTPPGGIAITPTEQWTYDNNGNRLTHRDPRDQTTSYAYDTRNRVTTVTQPPAVAGGAVGVTSMVWDDDGKLVSQTDANGGVSTATYDTMDRPLTTTVAVRNSGSAPDVISYRYNDFGDVTKIIRSDTVTLRTYDTAGELLTETPPARGPILYSYDVAGRLAVVQDSRGREIAEYDLAGRLTTVRHTDGGGTLLDLTRIERDPVGSPVAVTDPRGNRWGAGYDAAGRLVSRTDPAPTGAGNPVTTYGYDAAGNRTRVTDANGNATLSTYNSLGLPESTVEPATPGQTSAADRTWTTSYDAAGNPVRLAKPGGVVLTGGFDQRGQLTSVTGTGGDAAASKTYGYDQLGRMTSVNAPGGTQTFTYDDRGQLIAAAGPMGGASFTHDAAGRLTDEFDGTYHLTYTYSGYDVRTLTDNQAGTVHTFNHGPVGEISSVTDRSTSGAAGPTRTFTYDARSRPLTDTTTSPSGAVTASLAYTWDAAGNLASQTTGGQLANPRNTTYSYDQDNRLTRASDTAGATVSGVDYGWDATGNRTSVTTWTGAGHTPTGTTTATFDARNRLLGTSGPAGTTTNTWTPRGTMATRNGTTVGYDALDRLISDSGRSYQYDGLDRLASVKSGATTMATLGYSGAGAEPVRDGQFTYARSASGALLSARPTAASTATSLLSNAHGDVIAGTNPANGAVSHSRAYDPFGVVTSTTGTGSNVGYQGSWTDPGTGKVSAQARWYDPDAGAFSSRDSVSVPHTNAASTNRYSYAAANPSTFADPNGHCPPVLCNIGAAFEEIVSHLPDVRATGNTIIRAGPAVARAAPSVARAVAVGAQITGAAVACVIGCTTLVVGAIIVAVVVGVTVYLLVNANGTYTYQGDVTLDPETGLPLNAPVPTTTPVPRPTPRVAPNPAPVTPRVQPPKTWSAALAPQTWTVPSQWYDDQYLYLITDTYTTTLTQHWTYFNGITTLTGTTPHTTYNGRKTIAKPLFDTTNPIIIPTPIVGPQQPGKRAEPAQGTQPCTPTNTGPACTDQPHNLPTAGPSGPPTNIPPAGGPRAGSCDDPGAGGERVDPNLINFSQRNIAANRYAELMRAGLWDWNRPGTALRVMDRGGQLVSYDNRRLDGAREIRAEDPNYRVKVERVSSGDRYSKRMTWEEAFKDRFRDERNDPDGGCVPDAGLVDRPRWR